MVDNKGEGASPALPDHKGSEQMTTDVAAAGFDPAREAFDKHGIPFAFGDVVKVFHFVGARRKKHYMYKQVVSDRTWPEGYSAWVFSHLNLKPAEGPDGGFYIAKDGSRHQDYEIVQCCSPYPAHFSTRPRDSDGSREASETGTCSTEGNSAGPQGIAQTPDLSSEYSS